MDLYSSHVESFRQFESGKLNLEQCWLQQYDILEQCEILLKEQIKQLKLLDDLEKESNIKADDEGENENSDTTLAVVKNEVSITSNPTPTKLADKLEESAIETGSESVNQTINETGNTWSVGVLASLLKNEQNNTKEQEAKISKPIQDNLVCDECGAKFVNNSRVLKDHIEMQHLKMKYSCNHCQKIFRSRKQIFKHIRSETDVQSLRIQDPDKLMLQFCGICDNAPGTKDEMLDHLIEKHKVFAELYKNRRNKLGTQPPEKNSDKITPKKYKLEASKVVNEINPKVSVSSVKANVMQTKAKNKNGDHVKDAKNQPDDVSAFIEKMENTLQHYSKILNETSSGEAKNKKDSKQEKEDGKKVRKKRSDKKEYICKYCNIDFTDKPSAQTFLYNHINGHLRMAYYCKKCSYEVKSKVVMNDHFDEKHVHANVNMVKLRKMRTESIGLKCTVCKESFNIRSEIELHMESKHEELINVKKSNKGVREHQNNQSIRSLQLNQAKAAKIDQKKKLINCPQCSFKTGIIWNLKVHLCTHIGSNFTCTLCNCESKKKFNLMEHIKDSHSEHNDPEDRRWGNAFIKCACEACGISGKSVQEFDEHLVDVHQLPNSC